MKRIYYIVVRYSFILLALAGLNGLSSCVREEEIPSSDDSPAEKYLQIYINLPDLKNAKDVSTKAMDDNAERMITTANLNVLVFKDEAGTEEFAYKASISGNIEYDAQDRSRAKIIVKLIRGEDGEKYRLVVAANHNLSSTTLTPGETKEAVLTKLTYSVAGKWNASSSNYTPFPMWGETGLVTIDTNMTVQSVSLYRALARIDVGLDFIKDGTSLTENAGGLSDFKLKEVKVYRTYGQGYVAPVNSDIANVPVIPPLAERRAENAPLEYSIPLAEGADSYVREIYVPEADLPSSPLNDNMHCLVIGGYYRGSSTVTYYRLDFATETNPAGERTYLPICRNHRYVFNITQVIGPGFATPQEALESASTIENINYDMFEWDDTIHGMEVQGKYYFGLDQRNLRFEPAADGEMQIRYQTNLPATESVTFEWKSGASPVFSAALLSGTNEITVSTLTENITNATITDSLFVKSGPFRIPVHVEQRSVNFKYTINCESVNVTGTYIVDIALNATNHKIELTLTMEDNSLLGKPYILETEDLEGNHGISFRGEGIFSSYPTQSVTLTGSGMLRRMNNKEKAFRLRINSNSSSGAYCEATVNPVSPRLNIAVVGDIGNAHGYAISRLNGGAGKVFNHPNNFGPNDNSIVKIAGFNYVATNPRVDNNADLRKWITGEGNNGRIADIVYIAYPANFTSATAQSSAQLLINYMNKGGVVVAFLDNEYSAFNPNLGVYLTRQMTGNNTIARATGGGAGAMYGFPAYGLSGDQQEAKLREFEGDPIVNGPFGDARDRLWGEDASTTNALSNVPVDMPELTIYSTATNYTATSPTQSTNVTMYKFETDDSYNMVYVGDGGFMSSGYSGQEGVTTDTSNIICPFYWNPATYFPVPKPRYGSSTRRSVYNSIVFCNIMAWAVDKSQSLKAKRDSYITP